MKRWGERKKNKTQSRSDRFLLVEENYDLSGIKDDGFYFGFLRKWGGGFSLLLCS